MADAIIDIVGQEDLPVIVELYNRIYRPNRDLESFRRRVQGRHNVLQMVARIKDLPVAFFTGFELKPDTFFPWFYGVHSDFRRQGIATQLFEAVHEWAHEQNYQSIRLECPNAARPMLHLALDLEYSIVGIRWDTEHVDNMVICEKVIEG